MLRFLVACLAATASGYTLGARPAAVTAHRVAAAPVAMAEPSDKAVAIGAAAFGGIVGVQLTGELSTAVIFATALAYGSTLSNGFGDFSKKVGGASSKVYDKTLELNEQYDVLPKAKSAIDTVSTTAANLDANYGITAKIDEQLKLTEAVDKVPPRPPPHADCRPLRTAH